MSQLEIDMSRCNANFLTSEVNLGNINFCFSGDFFDL